MKKIISTLKLTMVILFVVSAITAMSSCKDNSINSIEGSPTEALTTGTNHETPNEDNSQSNQEQPSSDSSAADVIVDKHIHSFVEENTDAAYLKSASSCASSAVYYYSCECGEKGTQTFTVWGLSDNHIGGTQTGYMKLDNNTHTTVTYCLGCCEILETSSNSHTSGDGGACVFCEMKPGLYQVLEGDDLGCNALAPTKTWESLLHEGIIVVDENNAVSVPEDMRDNLNGCLVMSSGIERIKEYAFSNCAGLKGIVISEGVMTIEENAFSYCFDLDYVSIPQSVNHIGYHAFYSAARREGFDLNINDTAAWCKIYFGGEYSNPMEYASNVYVNNELANELIIPDGVESIGDRAFYGAPIISLSVPASVTQIGTSAFYGCEELASVIFANDSKLQTYGHHAFGKCGSLSYTEHNNAYYLGSQSNPYMILIKAANKEITSCEMHIDTRIIATYAFCDCSNLKTISMPAEVVFIGECAFQWTWTAPTSTSLHLNIVYDGTKAQFRAIKYEKSLMEIAFNVVCTNGVIRAIEITDQH